MAPSTSQQLQKLRSIHIKMSQMSHISIQKVQTQKSIYQQLTKLFSKFSSKVTDLSKKINQQILSPSLSYIFSQIIDVYYEQSVLHHYQFLSNSLLKLAESTKRISTNQKQQVLEPMKIFVNNYKTISDELLQKIVDNTTKLSQIHIELNRNKQHYYTISQKFQKQREMQTKIISKIQSGDKNQLQKFNAQIKKLSVQIINSQKSYKQSVQKINSQWQITKKTLNQTINSYSNNQETRVSFSKRSVISTLKLLQELENGFLKQADIKVKQTSKVQKQPRNNHFQGKLLQTLKQIKSIDQLQTFTNHEDFKKKLKRNQAIEQEHLQQIFKKVKPEDKQKIKQFVQIWFQPVQEQKQEYQDDKLSISSNLSQASSSTNNNSPTRDESIINKKYGNGPIINENSNQNNLSHSKSKRSLKPFEQKEQKLDDVKGKIIEVLPYSFYFIEQLYNQITNMSAFYCKMNDQNFYYLLNTFNVVTKSLDIDINNDINAQFIYKMVLISQRITWKRNNKQKNKSIELLSNHYSKNKQFFNNRKVINILYNYLVKKKSEQKKNNQNTKNTLSTFTKNIFSRKRQKQIPLTSDQQFTCLSQITYIMANLNIDKQISLTFIKDSIGQANSNKGTTFQYLKGLILAKKDIQERRKIFFKTQVKQKRQKKMKRTIQSKKIAEFCIRITAKRGFLAKDQLYLRLISKYLINVHWQILAHLQISTPQKWIHLLPYDKSLQYISMKQEVAQKSVPSATQEIITLDVNRSLHIHGQTLNPTVLHTLLRIYAFYHKDISYCQGMNYIAGYLYLKTLNQQSSYRIFQYLMQVRFKELFANEFQILKIKMYQFERLLSIFHPQISQHFKKQAISPQCYIVSWIITLFASSYQYTMQSYLIDTLWERFIIYGWKQFFRFILWIFDLKKQQLIELTYDRALHSLGEIAKSRFLLASKNDYKQQFKHIENVEDGMNRFEVTQQLLESLVSEYKLSK